MAGLRFLWRDLMNILKMKKNANPAYIAHLMQNIYNVLEDVYSVSGETQIQEAIDSIAVGGKGGTIFIESGTHVITAPLTIAAGGSYVIYGHGDNTILQPDDGISVFNITQADSIIFKTLRIDTSNYTGATSSVIVNEANDNVISFEDVSIIGNNVGSGIELISDNCMIEHCNISLMQDGIYINNSNRHIIVQNIIQNNIRYGININTSLYSSINGNTLNLNQTGIYVASSTNNSISNNICNLNTQNGIYLYESSYNTLSGNTCENNNSNAAGNTAGMYITNISNFNTISGNSLNNNNNAGAGDAYGLLIATLTCEENVVAANNYNANDIDIHDVGVGTTVEYYVQNVDELQDAINSIGSGAGIININSSFNVSATIVIDKNGSYLIEGEGDNTVLTTVGDIKCFNIDIARQVIFKNFKIDASSLTTATKEIIDVNEDNDNLIVFDNISITGDGTRGYGIELNSNNCRINNCNIEKVNIGINILSTDNMLQGNKTLNCNVNGIQISADNNMLNTNTCSNNVIGIYLNVADYNLIIGNYCESNTQWGIKLNDSNYNSVPNNYCLNNDGNSANPIGGIGIDGNSDNNMVIGNTSIDNNNGGAEDGYGLYLNVGTDDNYLLANWVSGNDNNFHDLGNNFTFSVVGHDHDGETLQLDGVDSNGGIFDFLTTGQVNFNQNIQVPNLITAGNVDGVDVSVLKTAHDNLKTDVDGFPDRLKNLTAAEIQQLESIDLKTISNAQWGYLGELDQSLKIASDVSHNKITLTAGNLVVGVIQLSNAEWTQLANIGIITISVAQWGYLGALDQSLTQASSPTFVGLTLSANLITTSTIDGVDVSVLKTDVDGFPDRLKFLTIAEINQLENIDLKTISNVQWGYLGGLDQALAQANSPTFGGLTLNGNIVMGGNKITGLGAPNANGEALRFENISNLVYDGVLWNGVIDVAPSKNAIRDVIDFLVTALTYKGTWTPNGYPVAPVIGDYYICDADGYVAADAPTPERWYEVGDWILWNGTIWNQMRNSFGDNVISVAPDDPIQLAIDEIESIGSGVISLLAGTHNLTAPLTINDVNVNILIKGAGESTIIDLNGDRTAFTITNAKSCILRDFKIDAVDLTTADEEIIDITEANDNPVIIENITITGDGTNGRGIEINSDNCKVEACTIDNIRFGILCIGNDNTIQENNVNSCNIDGIQIQGNNNSLYDNESDNNNRDGIRLNTGSYNQVNGNYIEGNAQDGIYLMASNYNAINDNYCIGNDSNTANPQGGIVIDADSDNNNIISNTSINNNNIGAGDGYGILINNADCNKNTIDANKCSGNDVQYKDVGVNTDIIYRCSDEDEIQDALDSIATKSRTVHILPIAGGIQLSATINIDGGGDYIIEGEGVGTIIDCAGDRTAFTITNAKSCILKNFKIDATDLTTNVKEIITVNEINDNKITIQNITITGHAVNQNGYGINFDSDNCEVKDCHLEDINYGLVLNGASYCEISNNFFDDIKTVDINLVSASNWNVITSNIHLNGDQVIVLDASTYNNINNNNMSSITTRGIYLTNNSDFCNVSNNIINAAKNGIRLNYSDQCIISGNILKDSIAGSDAGIYLTYTNRTLVSGNYIYNPFNRAIRLYHATYTNIEGNFVYYGYFGAISANDSDNVLIIGNYSNNCNQGNSGAAISLGGSLTNVSVIGNKIGGTTESYAGDLIGIYAQGVGTDNIFIANNFIYDIINNGAGDAIGISTDVNVVNGTIGINYITGVNTPYNINQASIVIFGDDTVYGISWLNNLGTATKNAIYNELNTYRTAQHNREIYPILVVAQDAHTAGDNNVYRQTNVIKHGIHSKASSRSSYWHFTLPTDYVDGENLTIVLHFTIGQGYTTVSYQWLHQYYLEGAAIANASTPSGTYFYGQAINTLKIETSTMTGTNLVAGCHIQIAFRCEDDEDEQPIQVQGIHLIVPVNTRT